MRVALVDEGSGIGPLPDSLREERVGRTVRRVYRATARGQKALAAAKAEGDSGLLAAHKGPLLSVETLGPRKIIVGKESTYEVLLLNSGEVAAEELIVFVSLPDWAGSSITPERLQGRALKTTIRGPATLTERASRSSRASSRRVRKPTGIAVVERRA